MPIIVGGKAGIVTPFNLSIPVGWLLALLLGLVFILLLRSKRLPASLALLALGIPVGMFWGSFLGLPSLHFGLSLPQVALREL